MTDTHRFDTRAIHAGVEPDPTTGAIMTPIYQTSTYVQAAPADHKGYEYSRTDNPTRTALQKSLAALEGGKHALSFSSGMAAIDTFLRLVPAGGHIIVGNDVYGGTYRLFDAILKGYGLTFTYVDQTNVEEVQAAITPETHVIWLETPTNPMLRLADIEAVANIAPDDVWVVVDNTFASPYLQNPLSLGADVVMHSVTKYIGGHSDVVGGTLIFNSDELNERLRYLQNAIGAVPGPQDCFLTLRGIKTLHLRMERHCENALAIARFLEDNEAFSQVIYPGLESHPQHDLATRQMRGYGGMISAILKDGDAAARKIVSQTKLFSLAESLGGVESLIEHPYSMTHASTADSDIAVSPGLIRFSVGVEHIEDLLDDLRQALNSL